MFVTRPDKCVCIANLKQQGSPMWRVQQSFHASNGMLLVTGEKYSDLM